MRFQSLAGFLVRCDSKSLDISINQIQFQSLAGFLVRCDLRRSSCSDPIWIVSIPGGFSCALRPRWEGMAQNPKG